MTEIAHIACGIILNPKNEIALVLNIETGNWSYPKGHVEPGESLLETAVRETREEAGLRNLTYIRELPPYERSTRQKEDKIKVMHLFLFQTLETELKSGTPDTPQVEWVPQDEVTSRFLYEEDVAYFNQIRAGLCFQESLTPS